VEPAAVICEIIKEDGEMARLPDLIEFAKQHNLKIGTIADLIHYRSQNERLVERVSERTVSTCHGEFNLLTYLDKTANEVHLALVKDSKGAASGLVTLEDLFEEIVGEVQDEFDLPQAWSLTDLVVPSAVAVQLGATDVDDAIGVLLERLCAAEATISKEISLREVLDRERRFSSAVGRGVAVPHARLPDLQRAFVALGRFARPVPFASAPDTLPIRLVFLVLTPVGVPVLQLRILARIAAIASNESIRRKMLRTRSAESLLDLLRTADTLLAT